MVDIGVLPQIDQGAMLADVVALIGTINFVLGPVNRYREGAQWRLP